MGEERRGEVEGEVNLYVVSLRIECADSETGRESETGEYSRSDSE